jgi:hypothetical protein
MSIATDEDRVMVRDASLWPGDCLCLKQYAADGRDYEQFGVIIADTEPVVVLLRAEDPRLDFSECVTYGTFEEMFAARWVVD